MNPTSPDLNLVTALRLSGVESPWLALVGAGGKTTALFHLARQLLDRPGSAGRVLVSATTHLAIPQLGLADQHFIVERTDEVAALEGNLPFGVVLLTGGIADGRVSGLNPATMRAVLALADSLRLPLLIEADGSRQRPLKAPADHEPALWPLSVGQEEWTVVVAAGLSALGKALSSEWVHRPEQFAALSGLALGEPITPQALARVLAHRMGGLKHIPSAARRVLLLNQADTAELQTQGNQLARLLLPVFPTVIIAALNPAGGLSPAVHAVHEPVAGIVLAAGEARRFGQPKQLLIWREMPLVRHTVMTALAAELSPVVVVTGAHRDGVQSAIQDLPIRIAHNPDWAAGQSTSLRAGLEALPAETAAAVFLLADQPKVPAALVLSLVEKHAATLSPLVAPLVAGQRANPVLFDRLTFPKLSSLQGDVGGRAVFSSFPVAWVAWRDETVLQDVDTFTDYARLLESDSIAKLV